MEKFVLVPYASYQSQTGVNKSPPGQREKSPEVKEKVTVKRRERDTANEKNKNTQEPLKWIDT